MSKISIEGNASGTGTLTIAAPNTNSNYTLTLPTETGTILTGSGNQAGSFTTLNTSGQVVFNDAGADVDFRVEGDTDANLLFVDASTDRVGIGTSTPSTVLHVKGSGAQYQIIESTDSDAGLQFISGRNYGILTEGGASPPLRFYDFTASAERMRLTSEGRLLIGTTASVLTGGDNAILAVQGNMLSGNFAMAVNSTTAGQVAYINFIRQNIQQGYIYSPSGGGTVYLTSSDYRLKANIAPMIGALNKVLELNPVTYTWKADGSAGQGFIAHELAEVFPDAVVGEKDAVDTYTDEDGNEQTRIKPQGIDTSVLVATLAAAIQELKAELDEAKVRIAALETGA